MKDETCSLYIPLKKFFFTLLPHVGIGHQDAFKFIQHPSYIKRRKEDYFTAPLYCSYYWFYIQYSLKSLWFILLT